MKKIFSVLTLLFSVFLMSCNNEVSNSMPNLKKIKDFAKYKSIGAGSISSTRSARSADGSVYVDPEEGVKLIGELSNGSVELIKFIDEEGNTKEQKWYLTALRVDTNLAILGFNTEKSTYVREDNFSSYYDENYVLDLKTGDLYSLKVFTIERIGAEALDKDGNRVTFASGTLNDKKGIYTFSTEEVDGNPKLKISYAYPDNINFPIEGKSDIYGNILSGHCIFKQGTISNLNTDKYFYLNPSDKKFYSWEELESFFLEDENYQYIEDPNLMGGKFKVAEYTINENGEVIVNTNTEYPCKEEYDFLLPKIHQRSLLPLKYLNYLELSNTYEKLTYIMSDFTLTDEEPKRLILSTPRLYEITYNKDGSIAEKKVTLLSEAFPNYDTSLTPLFSNNTDTIVAYSGSLDKDGSATFYKYNFLTDKQEKILEGSSIFESKLSDNHLYLYYYDEANDYAQVEYYIYPDGSVKNDYKDYSNHKVYLVPIA